jgi:hypothetical protein
MLLPDRSRSIEYLRVVNQRTHHSNLKERGRKGGREGGEREREREKQRERINYSLDLKCPQDPCVKVLVPSLVLLGGGRNFKKQGLVRGTHWGCALKGDSGTPVISSFSFVS